MMAATTSSSAATSTSHTSRYSINNPISRSRRPLSPWTQIVKGGDSNLLHAAPLPSVSASVAHEDPSILSVTPSVSSFVEPESSDNDNVGKKLAWNKPLNSSAEFGPLMGGNSWPALSISVRASTNGSSSMQTPQAAGSPLSSAEMPSVCKVNHSPTAGASAADNHNIPGQKKQYRRDSSTASSSPTISNPSHPGNVASSPISIIPPRDLNPNQRIARNSPFRNSHRNRNSSSYPRGDGIHHQNHGNKRNYDQGNNHSGPSLRNYNGRDVHMQLQQRSGLLRPQVQMGPPSFPTTNAHYMAPPPRMHSYGGPMLYQEYGSTVYMTHPPPKTMALVGQFSPQPMYFTGYDPMLFTKILKQVEFYFSADNLSKDEYLRQHMNDEGWVTANFIAGFRKLAELTNNVQLILDTVRSSDVVEVQGESIRRRGDWDKYIWRHDLRDVNTYSYRPAGAGDNHSAALVADLQNITLTESKNLEAEGESSKPGQQQSKNEVSASLTKI